MPDFIKNFSRDFHSFSSPESQAEPGRSLISFCEKLGPIFEIRDLLLTLKAQIPKKFKTGELLLFYNSEQLGLRRAYIRNSIFYEEEVKSPWEPVRQIRLCSPEENLYLANEFGRPFSKSLAIPLSYSESEEPALLFVEMNGQKQLVELLTDFFTERSLILNLVFKRVFLNSRWTKIPYLWKKLFNHWWEPLAILQDSKTILTNDSFKKNLSLAPNFFKQKETPEIIETNGKVYQLHYYPIPQPKNSCPCEILYCQDMTKHFYLKEQLFQSEKMASLCELGKNMAHQLNNPLTGVQSMAQILSHNPELENFKEELEEVEKAVRRSQKIIGNLLSFSKSKKEHKICDLNQVLEDTLPLLKSVTGGIQLKMEICSQPVEVKGDFTMLQQTAYNLILNACQALENIKEPCIQIKTNTNSKDHAYLQIRDNGPGIAQHNLEKIFQPLWTKREKNKGTGFGLGIARKFVRKLGGDITVSSRENEFACFTVQLPLYSSE